MTSPSRDVSTLPTAATNARREHVCGRPDEPVIPKATPKQFDLIHRLEVRAGRLASGFLDVRNTAGRLGAIEVSGKRAVSGVELKQI